MQNGCVIMLSVCKMIFGHASVGALSGIGIVSIHRISRLKLILQRKGDNFLLANL